MKDLEDDKREFPIRVYTKVELALLYAPHLSENAALNNLSRWMRHNKLLMAALEEVGITGEAIRYRLSPLHKSCL